MLPKVQEKTSNHSKRFLRWTILTIVILKLHEMGYQDNYISFPKDASLLKVLLKVQEKQATTPRVSEIDPHNHIYFETT